MIDDDSLATLLRSALPAAPDRGPARDLWPAVIDRDRPGRSWSWADLAASVLVAAAAIGSPGWLVVFAYYL